MGITSVDRVLTAVAGHGLRPEGAMSDRPLPRAEWAQLLARAEEQRLLGLLAAAVDANALPINDVQMTQLRERHRVHASHAIFVDRMLLQIVPVLHDHGQFRLVKGVAAARLDYPSPELRLYADADVLVPADQLPALISALRGHGLSRVEPERRPGHDQRFAKDLPMHTDGGTELDLHRTIVGGPIGVWLPIPGLFHDPESVSIAGEELFAVRRAVRYLHACLHALRRPPLPLWTVRDIAQIAASPLDVEEVLDLAARGHATGAVAWATRQATDTLQAEPTAVSRWASTYRPTDRDRWVVRGYVRAPDVTTHLSLATARVLPWADRVAYVHGMLRPSPTFLAARAHSRGGWVREALRRHR